MLEGEGEVLEGDDPGDRAFDLFVYIPTRGIYVSVNSKTAHAPPKQTPGHLTFLKNFGQIPRYVASLEGQMPHPLELQRGSNPPPSRHVKQTVETSSAKFSATTKFLVQLVFAPHFKQRHLPR